MNTVFDFERKEMVGAQVTMDPPSPWSNTTGGPEPATA